MGPHWVDTRKAHKKRALGRGQRWRGRLGRRLRRRGVRPRRVGGGPPVAVGAARGPGGPVPRGEVVEAPPVVRELDALLVLEVEHVLLELAREALGVRGVRRARVLEVPLAPLEVLRVAVDLRQRLALRRGARVPPPSASR